MDSISFRLAHQRQAYQGKIVAYHRFPALRKHQFNHLHGRHDTAFISDISSLDILRKPFYQHFIPLDGKRTKSFNVIPQILFYSIDRRSSSITFRTRKYFFLLIELSGISLENRTIVHKNNILQVIWSILKICVSTNDVVLNFRMSIGFCLFIFSLVSNQ